MSTLQPAKLVARNVGAVRRFIDPARVTQTVAGNPASTRLESGIGNCFPGLECDLRNLERRFFPFLEMDFVQNRTQAGIEHSFMILAGVDQDAVTRARTAGQLSAADAASYIK